MQDKTRAAFFRLVDCLNAVLTRHGLREVHDILWGRDDREFVAKHRDCLQELDTALKQVQEVWSFPDRAPDRGHMKYLLWQYVSRCARRAQAEGRTAALGLDAVLVALRPSEGVTLVCVPLHGSYAPLRPRPTAYPLGDGVWLIEPCWEPARLLPLLEKVMHPLPEGVIAPIQGVVDPTQSELGGLLVCPLIAFQTSGFYASRPHAIRCLGLPLLCLHNLVTALKLDTSDDIGWWGYLTHLGDLNDLPPPLREEWVSLWQGDRPPPDFPEFATEPVFCACEAQVCSEVVEYKLWGGPGGSAWSDPRVSGPSFLGSCFSLPCWTWS